MNDAGEKGSRSPCVQPLQLSAKQGMMHFIHQALQDRRLRFLIAGGWNTVFGYTSFAVLYWLLSRRIHYLVILVGVAVINITMAFFTHKFFVFRTRGNYVREYLRYYVVYAVPVGIGFIAFPFCIEFLHMNAYLTQLLITGITVVMSYFGHKHVTFRV
jgi:putative flippase GtrA